MDAGQISSPIPLTADAIELMYSPAGKGQQYIVQVMDVKHVQSTPHGPSRFRLIISDGTHFCAAVLTTALRDKADELSQFCILRINMHEIMQQNKEPNGPPRSIIVIIDAEPVHPALPGRVGRPALYTPREVAPAAPVSAPAIPADSHRIPAPAPAPAPAPYVPPVAPAPPPPPFASMPVAGAGRPTGPTVRAPDYVSHTVPLAALQPYGPKWTVKARITAKTDIKQWTNARGQGKLFSVTLLDDQNTEMRATFFQGGVDRFFPLLQLNKVYLFSGGKLKTANRQYSPTSDYEINFDDKATITEVTDDARIARNRYTFVPIGNLVHIEPNVTLDVIGVVTSANATTNITGKSGKELVKRDLHLGDQSGAQVVLTLWGDKCDTAIAAGDILAVKGVKLGDYGGRSLSTMMSTQIEVNPDLQTAHELQGWWSTSGSGSNFKSLTERPGGAGGENTGPIANVELRKRVSELKDTAPAGMDGPIQVIKATIHNIKRDDVGRMTYPACPATVDGRTCNKKLTLQGESMWSCERCGVQTPSYRYILSAQMSDESGSEYVTLFDAEAKAFLGIEANDLTKLVQQHATVDAPEVLPIFARVDFKELMLTTKAKMEDRGGENRLKATIVKVRKIDYAAESKALINMLKKLKPV